MSGRHSPLWPDARRKPPYGAVEIDWAHPLAQGLIGLWIINEGAGAPFNLMRRFPSTVSGSVTWGVDLALSSTGKFSDAVVDTKTLTTQLTLVASWSGMASASLNSVARWDGGSSAAYHILGDYSQLQGVIRTSVNTYTTAIADAALRAGCIAALTWGADAANMYANGKLVAGPTATSGTLSYPGFGSQAFVVGDAVNAKTIKYVALYGVALDASSVAALYADPYCFLRPVKRRSYGFVGAAAPSGWKPAWAVRPQRTIGTGVI